MKFPKSSLVLLSMIFLAVQFQFASAAFSISGLRTDYPDPVHNNGSFQDMQIYFQSSTYPLDVEVILYKSGQEVLRTPYYADTSAASPIPYSLEEGMDDGNYDVYVNFTDETGYNRYLKATSVVVESTLPRLNHFTVSSESVPQGTPFHVSGKATAGSSCIVANRFYVPGSQGGVWTTNNCVQEVTLNGDIPTFNNPKSFYRGPGLYELAWEVKNQLGEITTYDSFIDISEGSGNQTPQDTTPPNRVGTILITFNSTYAKMTWTNPSDPDFSHVIIDLNDVNVINTSSQSYEFRNLVPNTRYDISLRTVDASGNINSIPRTAIFTTPSANNSTNTPSNSASAPQISSFAISSASVPQGTPFHVSGQAAAGSSCIMANRFFVVGSQGGVWTANDCVQSVNLNSDIPTLTNPRSFYHGVGSYTLRWEIKNQNGEIASRDLQLSLIQSDPNNNNTGNSSIASVTNLSPVSVTQNSITWNWTNPASSDFKDNIIYINAIQFATTTSNTYTLSGLEPGLQFTIAVYTRDTSGNVNPSAASSTVYTLPRNAPFENTTRTSSSGGSSNSGGTKRGTTYFSDDNAGDDSAGGNGGTSIGEFFSSSNSPTLLTYSGSGSQETSSSSSTEGTLLQSPSSESRSKALSVALPLTILSTVLLLAGLVALSIHSRKRSNLDDEY